MALEVLNYGATITRLEVPDKNARPVNVVVGLDSAEAYLSPEYIDACLSLGASIGRYAGRISGNSLKINNRSYPIFNEDDVHLHGGKKGFDKRIWDVDSVSKGKDPQVTLSYSSEHLEEGYPGKLSVRVTYKLLESNTLKIIYTAETDRPTHVNLTNHSYFNLDGYGSVLEHRLRISSDRHLETNEHLIPSGRIIESENTRFDFKAPSRLGRSGFIGFDDCFVFDNSGTNRAVIASEKSGIVMDLITNQPAVVIYTRKRFPDLGFNNSDGYEEYPAICFETQNFPDAPNNEHFPSSLLLPGETYRNESSFKFTVSA